MRSMTIIGLTGGIGSGKSTVSKMFEVAGIPIIDADKIAHSILMKGDLAYAQVCQHFPEVVGLDGEIDRKVLGKVVFAEEKKRKFLESIMHPIIAEAMKCMASAYAEEGYKVVVYDAPLLMEAGHDIGLPVVVLVYAEEKVQLARALARGGLSEDDIKARIAAQMPWDRKWNRATHVIDNSGDIEHTRARVKMIVVGLGLPWPEDPKSPMSS